MAWYPKNSSCRSCKILLPTNGQFTTTPQHSLSSLHARNRLRTRGGHTEAGHYLGKTPWPSPRLVGLREVRPVRVEGILHTAVAVPPRGTRMVHNERTAEDDTLYSSSSTIERRPF